MYLRHKFLLGADSHVARFAYDSLPNKPPERRMGDGENEQILGACQEMHLLVCY